MICEVCTGSKMNSLPLLPWQIFSLLFQFELCASDLNSYNSALAIYYIAVLKLPATLQANPFHSISILTHIWPLASVHFGPWSYMLKMAVITVNLNSVHPVFKICRSVSIQPVWVRSLSQMQFGSFKPQISSSTERKIQIFLDGSFFWSCGCEATVAVKYFIMHAYMVLVLGGDPKKIRLLFSQAAGRLLRRWFISFFFPLSLNIFSWAGARSLRHIDSLMRMFVSLWVS